MEQITFYDQVYQVVRLILAGRVSSYGLIVGTKGSARMVECCKYCYPPVPAHLVLNRQAMLTGKFHFGSPDMMQQLLENEVLKID